jgi:hypothetical protein
MPVELEHEDGERLGSLLDCLARLLDARGPEGLTDAQVDALCAGHEHSRDELRGWLGHLTADLREKS